MSVARTLVKFFQFFLAFLFLFSSMGIAQQYRIDTLFVGPNIAFPVAIAFPPDGSGRIFFTEKNMGRVRVARHDTLLASPFLTVTVTGSGEQGLLGICFHPQYPDSPYVYVYYTRSGDRANQLVRYRDQGGAGVNPETLMVVLRLTSATNHNGGNIHFGPDGKLYVTVGDYAVSSNSQDTSNNNKRGKIHRLNYDGSIPSDNPFPGNSIYVYGCRNSFDFTFDPLTGQCYASENGPNCNDEVNYILPGGNYGWPVDGNCTYSGDTLYMRPMYYWPTNLPAVTGIVLYRGSAFPQLYGKMFVSNYNYGSVFQFTLNATGDTIISGPTILVSLGSGLNDVEVGPDGYIYIANGDYGGTSRIFRLRPLAQLPGQVILVNPPNFSNVPFRILTYRWRVATNATSYWLEVSHDSTFTTIIRQDSALADTFLTVTDILRDTVYYWRVRGGSAAGYGPFSERWQFTSYTLPSQVMLISPADSSVVRPDSVEFRWQAGTNAVSYWFELAHDTSFQDLVERDTSVLDTMKLVQNLMQLTDHYWRARAKSRGGYGLFSMVWYFFTHEILAVDEKGSLPKEFALHQNYPNPFNPTTQITYDLPEQSYVRLSVSNILGQELRLLYQGVQQVGRHTTEFDASNLSSGVYFYRLEARPIDGEQTESFRALRKMIVIK